MKARFEDRCAYCRRPIRVGQAVGRFSGRALWHTKCLIEYQKTRQATARTW